MQHQVWAEINTAALHHNVEWIKARLLPGTGVIGVVKANAYGHGLEVVARILDPHVDMYAVTSMEEAIALRKMGFDKAILNMSYTASADVEEAITKRITVCVYDLDSAKMIHEIASRFKKPIKVHIKIDTGMHRLGVLAEDVSKVVPEIMRLPYFRVEGIFSHFADESDKGFVNEQFEQMQNALFALQQAKMQVPAVHMAKSSVLFQSQDYHFDAVRPGLALYGYGPEGQDLQASMQLKTVLMQKKRITKGARVGYMQSFIAKSDMTIGVIPIGYSHGFDRGLSNKGYVLVDGWRCPVIGIVCMSQTIIDLSAVKSRLLIGDEVVALGKQKNQEITVAQLADWVGTNKYEIVTRIPSSVHRIYEQ